MVDRDGEDVLEHDLEVAPSEDEEESDPRRDLRAEAVSTRHLLTHQPKNRYCKAFIRCKMQPTPCKRGASSNMVPGQISKVTFVLATTLLPMTSCLRVLMVKKNRLC